MKKEAKRFWKASFDFLPQGMIESSITKIYEDGLSSVPSAKRKAVIAFPSFCSNHPNVSLNQLNPTCMQNII